MDPINSLRSYPGEEARTLKLNERMFRSRVVRRLSRGIEVVDLSDPDGNLLDLKENPES